MFYKVSKKAFKLLINFLHIAQLLLIFLSFLTIFYWLLQIGGVKFIDFFAPVFEGIKSFVHLFYQRKVTFDEATVDFSFLIAAFIMLFIVKLLNVLAEQLKSLEEHYDTIYKKFKSKSEKLFNIALEREYLTQERKINKVIFLINFSILNIANDSFFTNEENIVMEEKKKAIALDFCEDLKKVCEFDAKFLSDGILLYLNNIDNIDRFFKAIEETVKKIQLRYKEEKLQIKAFMSIEVYSKEEEIISKIRNLIILIRLGLENKIACLSTFRHRYSLLKRQNYVVESYGFYNINEKEEVFYLEKIR